MDLQQDNRNTKANSRLIHYDLLRIFACFSVVMLHSAAQFWYSLPVDDPNWLVANSYDAIFRFGVPIFIMISGVMFLDSPKEIQVKRLFTHNILRIFVIYAVWSVAYGLFDCRRYPLATINKGVVMDEIIANRYHLWFLPMIAGIYFLLPILKQWICNAPKKNIEYFIVLFVFLQVGKETLLAVFKHPLIGYFTGFINLYMVAGYLGYFIIGYYIAHYGMDKKWHKWIYLSGILSAFFNILLGNYLAVRTGQATGDIYDSFGIFTFCIVISIFLFFSDRMSKITFGRGVGKLITEVSKATFGIYLMHIALIEYLEPLGIHSMMIPPILGIPLLALGCFVVCFLASALLRRIPFVGKYIC